VDRAPKRFAAGVGFLFSLSFLILSLIPYTLAAGVLAGILVLFASLEAFFAFCAGCYVYFFLKKLGV
jgi:predicted benzoate:H+ symporter BenE